jgi:hypothetical protein
MHPLDVPLLRHRQIALDDYRHDPAILGHGGHVERDVASSDGSVAEQAFQNAGDLLVGDLRIVGTSETSGCQQSLGTRDGAGDDQAGDTHGT